MEEIGQSTDWPKKKLQLINKRRSMEKWLRCAPEKSEFIFVWLIKLKSERWYKYSRSRTVLVLRPRLRTACALRTFSPCVHRDGLLLRRVSLQQLATWTTGHCQCVPGSVQLLCDLCYLIRLWKPISNSLCANTGYKTAITVSRRALHFFVCVFFLVFVHFTSLCFSSLGCANCRACFAFCATSDFFFSPLDFIPDISPFRIRHRGDSAQCTDFKMIGRSSTDRS